MCPHRALARLFLRACPHASTRPWSCPLGSPTPYCPTDYRRCCMPHCVLTGGATCCAPTPALVASANSGHHGIDSIPSPGTSARQKAQTSCHAIVGIEWKLWCRHVDVVVCLLSGSRTTSHIPCWGPSSSEGPQKHNLTMSFKYGLWTGIFGLMIKAYTMRSLIMTKVAVAPKLCERDQLRLNRRKGKPT
jgi:hypothetical protein